MPAGAGTNIYTQYKNGNLNSVGDWVGAGLIGGVAGAAGAAVGTYAVMGAAALGAGATSTYAGMNLFGYSLGTTGFVSGAASGGIGGAVTSIVRQAGNGAVGWQDEFSFKEIGIEAAMGFGIGGAIGGISALINKQPFWWGNSTKIVPPTTTQGKIRVGKAQPYVNEHIKGINRGAQTKHIPGSHNYDPLRSKLLVDPDMLLKKVYTLDYDFVRYNPRGMPVLKFKNPIGIYVQHGKPIGVTNLATMSFKKSTGMVHFIPAWQ